ncbi:MAG: YfiR family protein [Desulfuromonadaceae bacterium]|nr:YfiR family protein [Desulfuromonadaceae bacterium]
MHVSFYRIIALILLVCGLHGAGVANGVQSDESQIKAVFVLNFAKLTEWQNGHANDNSTFSIAILGKTPSPAFIKTLQSQTIRGAKVSVRHIDEVAEARGVRLIFISATERYRLSGLLRELNQQNILTVSDMTGFCEAGGMIGLIPVQNRLNFEVNLAAVRKSHLVLSSQLLKLARTIYGNTP